MVAVQQKAVVPGGPPPPAGPPTPLPVSGKVSCSGHLGSLSPHCCTVPGQTETCLLIFHTERAEICAAFMLYVLFFFCLRVCGVWTYLEPSSYLQRSSLKLCAVYLPCAPSRCLVHLVTDV